MMGGVPTSGNGTIVKRVIRGFDKPELVDAYVSVSFSERW